MATNLEYKQLVVMLPMLCYTCAPWCIPSVMGVHSSVHVQLAIFPTQHMVCWDGACAACVYTICVCYVHCVLYPRDFAIISHIEKVIPISIHVYSTAVQEP